MTTDEVNNIETFSPPVEFRIYTNVVNSTEMLGRLYEKDGRLYFDGDADASAEEFFSHLCRLFSDRIDTIVADRIKAMK